MEVMKGIRRKTGVSYPVLTPNLKGFQAAVISPLYHTSSLPLQYNQMKAPGPLPHGVLSLTVCFACDHINSF